MGSKISFKMDLLLSLHFIKNSKVTNSKFYCLVANTQPLKLKAPELASFKMSKAYFSGNYIL